MTTSEKILSEMERMGKMKIKDLCAQMHWQYQKFRQQLIKFLDRLSIFQETAGLVTLNISKDSLHLDAVDKDLEMDGEENLPCECDDDPMLPMKIGMKMPTLLSILKALSSEKVILRIIDPAYAIVIQPVTQPDVEHITMLIMPMHLND